MSAVAAGSTGTVVMNRFDRMQIIANSGGDISGTIIDADKRIAVWGGSECENVPSGVTFCDHIEEQMLPLNYWGQYYVAPTPPQRGRGLLLARLRGEGRHHHLDRSRAARVPDHAQQGGVHQPRHPRRRDLLGRRAVLAGPVPRGENGGAGIEDPSMYQMVPVGQFLSAYAFATGISSNYPTPTTCR